jgi:hypothetical protein
MAKAQIELISVTVKINGKKRVFKKGQVYFTGWEQECGTCGSHSGVDMTIYDESGKKPKSYTTKLE